MGGCLSKCLRKDEEADVPAKWAEKRVARKASLEEFIGKETNDAWSADIDESFAAKPPIVVSPMNVDDFAKLGEYPQSPQSRTSHVTSSVSIASSSQSNVEDIAIDKPVVKPENGTSQPLDSGVPPKKKVSRTRILQLVDNSFEEELEIIEVDYDNEVSNENKMNEAEKAVVTHELEEMDYSWVEAKRKASEILVKEPEVTANNVKVVKAVEPPKGPGVTVINVRPKTPEQIKIEFKPKIENNLVLPVNKEQMVPKQSEMASLDMNDDEDNVSNDPSMETDTDCSSGSNGVSNSDPILAEHAPVQGAAAGSDGDVADKPKKAKKMRPRRIYPYTRGRMIPQAEFPEIPPWFDPKPAPTVKMRIPQHNWDYEAFANRFLKPFEKAQATEGKVLDGTLITWPKLINDPDCLSKTGTETTGIGGRFKSKMAWGGETQLSLPAPVLNTSFHFKPRSYNDISGHDHRITPGILKIVAKKDGQTEPKRLNEDQIMRFAYQPPEFFVRPKEVPFFKEQKLTFHPSVETEESDEDIDFVFTPENLRRYAKRRQEKLRRRPKTPFHRNHVSARTKSDKPAEVPQQPVVPRPQTPDKSTKAEITPVNGSKCVSFVIPLEHRGKCPPTSRPNTRRGVRPKTPRADAEELALRQANAEKRREQVLMSRARALTKMSAQEREVTREKAEKDKAEKLKEKMDNKMKQHRENRRKKIERIVSKQTEHIKHVKDKHDVVFTRKRFMGLEKESDCPDPNNVEFTLNDIMDIDRFFDKMDD